MLQINYLFLLIYCLELGTKFSIVRYGNVVGSRGSVFPLFKKIISENKKILPITHPNMTRFWITEDQGVNFVLNSFQRMIGGEIFIPIMPSIKITDLAKSMGNNIKIKIIGIRPGEKIHELLYSSDESESVRQMKNHLVIIPTFTKNYATKKYVNNLKEIGKKVKMRLDYSSGKNKKFLSVSEIKKLNKKIS